jgi:hypothetical protein
MKKNIYIKAEALMNASVGTRETTNATSSPLKHKNKKNRIRDNKKKR